jgi:hypothetical protein
MRLTPAGSNAFGFDLQLLFKPKKQPDLVIITVE